MIRPYTYFDQNHGEPILMSISNRFHLYGFLTYSNPGMIQSEEGRVFEEVKLEKPLTQKTGTKISAIFRWNPTWESLTLERCRLGQ